MALARTGKIQMSDTLQVILGFCFLIAVFILTRIFISKKMANATHDIIRVLETKGAFDPITAVDLPFAKVNLFRIGMRNYHRQALQAMVSEGVVMETSGKKYYLQGGNAPGATEKT